MIFIVLCLCNRLVALFHCFLCSSMDLARTTQEGLALYADATFSEADFKPFLQATFASLVGKKASDGKEAKDEKTPELLQSMRIGVCMSVTLSCNRFAVGQAGVRSHSSLRIGSGQNRRCRQRNLVRCCVCCCVYAEQCYSAVLEDSKLPEARIKFFVALFEQYKPSLRSMLAATSFSFPSIVAFKWRMDYYLKSGALEQIRQPVYFIQLKTQQADGSTKDVEFSADFNELQDFLFKLKDAQNQVIKKVLV